MVVHSQIIVYYKINNGEEARRIPIKDCIHFDHIAIHMLWNNPTCGI